EETDDNSHNDAADREHDRLAHDDVHDVELRRSHRLEDSDFAGALHDCGVHGLEDHDEANHHRNPDNHIDETGQARIVARGHHRNVVRHGNGDVVLHPLHRLDFFDYLVGVGRIVEFQVEDGGLSLRADQVLQDIKLEKPARTLSGLHDAADAECVIEQL